MVCNDDGHVVVNAVSGELAQATAMATGRRVAVIVPASDVLATDSDAPAKSAAKLAQVIPYALEERVADEIENLHFAIGDRDADTGRVPVVVVARARIDELAGRAACRRAQCRRLSTPRPRLLPAMPGQMIALLDGDSLTLRAADASAAGDAGAVDRRRVRDGAGDAGLRRWPGSSPRRSACCCTPATTNGQAHQNAIDALRDRFTGVKVQLLPSGPLSVLAPAAASGDAVNLLQGALAVASPLQQGWRVVAHRRGAGRVAALPAPRCALLRAHRGCDKSEAALDASIQDAFRAAMPGQQNATNARRRVEQRLAADPQWRRRRRPAARRFRPSPTRAMRCRTRRSRASPFATAPSTCASIAPDAASLDAIGQQLRAASWQADIMGGSASGDSYRGTPAGPQGGCLMRAWYANLAERERRVVTLGGVGWRGAAVVSHHPAAEPQHRAGAPARHHQTR